MNAENLARRVRNSKFLVFGNSQGNTYGVIESNNCTPNASQFDRFFSQELQEAMKTENTIIFGDVPEGAYLRAAIPVTRGLTDARSGYRLVYHAVADQDTIETTVSALKQNPSITFPFIKALSNDPRITSFSNESRIYLIPLPEAETLRSFNPTEKIFAENPAKATSFDGLDELYALADQQIKDAYSKYLLKTL